MDQCKKSVTRDEIRDARRRDLLEFLHRYHPDAFNKSGNTSLCFRNKDSIYIKRGVPGFHDFSNGAHGNSIDFLTGYMGYSFTDAVRALNRSNSHLCQVHAASVPDHKSQGTCIAAANLPPPADKPYRRMYAYLMSRGIPVETVQWLETAGLLYQERNNNNIVFISPERDYCELRGTYTFTDRPFKGCRKAAPDRSWYFSTGKIRPEKAYICEGAIDAVSLMLLRKEAGHLETAAYFSIGGVANQQAIDRIRNKFSSVIVAVDNDIAGEMCRKRNADLECIVPINKDWNDDLQKGVGLRE